MSGLGMGGAEQAFVSMINGWSIPNTFLEIVLKRRGGILEDRLRKDFPIITKHEALNRSYDAAVCYAEWLNPKRGLRKVHAIKKIQWIHTDLVSLPYTIPFKKKSSYKSIDAFVCISKRVAESVLMIAPEVGGKIFTVHNVLDGELIKSKAKEEAPHLPQDGICNVVSVGRLCRAKAFERALRVHERLEKEGVHFRWYIVGEGTHRAKLEQEIAARKMDGKFILLGQKANPYPYILQADIFAAPSLVEGWSLVVTEAKILGRPILFTDVGGAREQISSEKNGLIVANNEEAIYLGMKRLLADEKLRHMFSHALDGFVYDNSPLYDQIEGVLFQPIVGGLKE